ncbi:hypothetical protein LTR36_007179 [Oleoguttula mirabilis]|uniref:PDZ GRASP-type domain-containing protein n=1 Tax=Oleoguttula mirabilis TaxID=1507867 RepID=A0AAV9JAI7_9PEZI|nr:hypothetical protein LTR36_007179 [Oleoguttula mirabilis]
MANMFGALNRFISRLDSDPQPQQSRSSASGHGFQVLRNTDSTIPLDPWFDFIIGINGRTIDNPDPSLFATEVRNSAGSTISLGVFGTKGQQIREIYVSVPQDQTASLGLALQWCPLNATEDVWHILDVMPNSPADVAGLLPYSDYVIGSPDGNLQGDAGLGGLVEQSMDQSLRLYVYNHEYDVTRMITITPSKHWGGEGALGCVLGYGALHRVPAPLNEPAQAPGETLFESGGNTTTNNEQQSTPYYQPTDPHQAHHEPPPASSSPSPAAFLVPANMHFANPSPPPPTGAPPPGRAKKARAHHAIAPIAGLDDYFKEGEQKSRELDRSSTPKASGGLPPPPKGGGPPKAASPAPENS